MSARPRNGKPLSLRLAPETKELLRRVAEADKRSMTAAVEWLVRERARVPGLPPERQQHAR